MTMTQESMPCVVFFSRMKFCSLISLVESIVKSTYDDTVCSVIIQDEIKHRRPWRDGETTNVCSLGL